MAAQRHERHVQEVEKKIRLNRMNNFVKNHEESLANPDRPPPEHSLQMNKLVDEVRAMRKDVREKNMEVERMEQDLERLEKEQREKHLVEPKVHRSEDLSFMYPVAPDVKKQLYTGLSTNSEGRYRYLKTRRELDPKEKYRSWPTHNYRYGWEVIAREMPAHGKKNILKTATYSLHGFTLYHTHPTNRPPLPHPSLDGEIDPPVYSR